MRDPEAVYIGTEPWKPKEALEEGGLVTDKADIFAFGLTLWEMMTLSVPHLNLPGDDEESAEGASAGGGFLLSWLGSDRWKQLSLEQSGVGDFMRFEAKAIVGPRSQRQTGSGPWEERCPSHLQCLSRCLF